MARSRDRVRVVRLEPPAGAEVEGSPPQVDGCTELVIGCLALLAGLGAFITGVTGILMAWRHSGIEAGLYLIAAALAFGLLVITLFRG